MGVVVHRRPGQGGIQRCGVCGGKFPSAADDRRFLGAAKLFEHAHGLQAGAGARAREGGGDLVQSHSLYMFHDIRWDVGVGQACGKGRERLGMGPLDLRHGGRSFASALDPSTTTASRGAYGIGARPARALFEFCAATLGES